METASVNCREAGCLFASCKVNVKLNDPLVAAVPVSEPVLSS